jgi:small subunit ribosomal protein S16
MVVRIRLAMHGRRHRQIFHLVAINAQKARDAKPIETLGIYDPAMTLQKHKTVEWSVNRIKYWLGVGALPSKTVVRLLEVVSSNPGYHELLGSDTSSGRCHSATFEIPSQEFGPSCTPSYCAARLAESSNPPAESIQ